MKFTMEDLQKEIIGVQKFIDTPYGERLITYADYTASGKSLKFIEKYLIKLQEVYANSHTEESATGKIMTELVHKSEVMIKKSFNALENSYVIPVGSGATGAIQKLASIFGIYYPPAFKKNFAGFIDDIDIDKPVVFISSYEHHSNDLIWREGYADVVEIDLTKDGQIDLKDLEEKISKKEYANRKKIGSISASSNVTGVKSDVYEIARILHKHDTYACFDFAASGPYVEIDMNKNKDSYFDAIYLSPHKFIGGPGSSGLLLINKKIYDKDIAPTIAGGGTVDYVSSTGYDFIDDVEAREMAGTPGILQIIKAALAIELKDVITTDAIEKKEAYYIEKVFEKLLKNPKVEILGPKDPHKRVGIMSFNLKYGDGYLHHKFVTKLLNDIFGIQSRGGCACAGPYGHKLLEIDDKRSSEYREVVVQGYNSLKPGWVRVNFHYLATEPEVDYIVEAIEFIAEYGYLYVNEYTMDINTGLWTKDNYDENSEIIDNFSILESFSVKDEDVFEEKDIDYNNFYKIYLSEAYKKAEELKVSYINEKHKFNDKVADELRWYPF